MLIPRIQSKCDAGPKMVLGPMSAAVVSIDRVLFCLARGRRHGHSLFGAGVGFVINKLKP
jgi:hypothetical protein